MRTFDKKTTNVGGCTGVIIPNEVLYAEGIKRGDQVRIIIELLPTKDLSGVNQRYSYPFENSPEEAMT